MHLKRLLRSLLISANNSASRRGRGTPHNWEDGKIAHVISSVQKGAYLKTLPEVRNTQPCLPATEDVSYQASSSPSESTSLHPQHSIWTRRVYYLVYETGFVHSWCPERRGYNLCQVIFSCTNKLSRWLLFSLLGTHFSNYSCYHSSTSIETAYEACPVSLSAY